TFVAREHQMAAEWQGAALGPGKWKRGRKLAEQLRDRLAPGGVVLHRMGKHYPGESLPRWALDVIARRDTTALWPQRRFPDLDWSPGSGSPQRRARELAEATATARHFAEELAAALGVIPELHPAYEDPWEVIRAEARLPATIDPRAATSLDDSEERGRLARVLDQGVGRVIGWVLPLARAEDAWRTQRWTFRREHLFLLPGESPLGLRLPLDSLLGTPPPTWAEEDLPDPRRDEPDAKPAHDVAQPRMESRVERRAVARPERTDLGIRTAISIEPRDGQLWIFLPPLATFEDFCALVGAIDDVRVAVSIDIHLEGYPPPPSPTLLRFAVTPDPGVLEVNLPPQTSARAMAELHATVFDTALACGLTAERYLLDGRAAGSGGGNHITIGGPTPATSPWFARPDLLASLLAFVQHHPSLSYMFSGLFVGPTSQAPRVDEARHDALYELELALPRLHEHPPVWQVDALLRHLLVDVAGNTHRAEISIDKLFDPLTPFGRQGLVELRAFEMPPHPRMCAAQVVLVRTLLAALAAKPYRHALVRWGVELHDKFLLPYWMGRDFEDVLAHLASCGHPLPVEAFLPFIDLRCPLAGTIALGDGRVEIRNAIEPWHVLGEEATATGTARYVDSSLERLELRAIGLDPERYLVTINGYAVPLRTTARRDTRVGGVRFRAWCPPHALQPHLGIHHPLRIEIVDTWGTRSVAAGTYHVWHPEGQGFEAAPLTRVEAAARRAQRFTLDGGTPSPLRPLAAAPHPDQPYTLDLRRLDVGRPMPRTEDFVAKEPA
ncbi:MAG: transglutaminase family protein, partial [Deltaproteobacteria bacterium]|nr:transglutaminase family protein [Deltaproteobacteria bacterium]